MKLARLLFFVLLLGAVSCEQDPALAPYSDLMTDEGGQDIIFPMSTNEPVEYLVVHCTASPRDLTKEWLLDFFLNERGWSKPGYNLLVTMDGTLDTLVPYDLDGRVSYDEIAYGARGFNSVSIHVSYTGGVDYNLKPKDTRTPEQKATLQKVVDVVRCQFPGIEVVGHTELPRVNKACPSFSVQREY